MVYCGKDCQKAHWPEHKILCNAIKHEIEQKTPKTKDTSSGFFVSHQDAKVISLVGRGCAIKARLNEKVVRTLWDTGAQVFMISTSFIREHFPNVLIRDVGDLLDGDLNLTAANGSDIPYRGCVELDLQIGDSEHVLSVRFLVTDEKVGVPLVVFNVIEHLIKFNKLNGDEIAAAFVRINAYDSTALVNLVNSANHDELCVVKTCKKDVVVPRGQSVKLNCRVNAGPLDKRTPVLFESDENPTWPSGLQVSNTLLTANVGKSSRFK